MRSFVADVKYGVASNTEEAQNKQSFRRKPCSKKGERRGICHKRI